ncbi:MAG: aminotransferase class I/II-fold pyridoxal phosphate-dependent enzyme [bacterium]
MDIKPSKRLESLKSYAFDDVEKEVSKLKAKGIFPIDFGVGDPKDPTPNVIRSCCKRAIDKRKSSGYPNYIGDYEFRSEIKLFMKIRHNIELDENKEIMSTIGSKEAIFNFPNAFVEDKDYVLVPNPGYPPYETGTIMAGGTPYFMNLTKENNFYPDFDLIPKKVLKKAKIMWLNYPNNPTSQVASAEFYKKAYDFCQKNNIILASDEAYTDNYFEKKPISILNVGKKGVIVFKSFSKMANMTTYRVGWCCGDEKIIEVFKKLKTNIDSGTPTFVQDAGIAALEDDNYHIQLRNDYKFKRNAMIDAFTKIGLEVSNPEAGIYLWVKVPKKYNSLDFAKKLLEPEIAIVCTPGLWLGKEFEGKNPGEGYLRFALVPTIEEIKEAANRIIYNLKF